MRSHTHRQSPRTCRRHRRDRPSRGRHRGRPRSRVRFDDAPRATARAGAEARGSGRARRRSVAPRPCRARPRARATGRLHGATRAPGHPARERGRPRRDAEPPPRRARRHRVRAAGVHAPSTSERTAAPARRRRSPTGPWRMRAFCQRTRHIDVPATGQVSRTARRPAARAGRTTRDTQRRAAGRAPRRSRTARAEGCPAPARLDRTDEAVTTPCQIGAETSSRRSSCARSRSAGVLIGRNRPREPRRGTSRYCAGTKADSSWYSRSSCTARRPSTSLST
jgi:hypothetical protein